MRSLILVTLLVLVPFGAQSAPSNGVEAALPAPQTAPQITPVTGHPRLWLRSDDLPRLRSWATASNPIFQEGLSALATMAKSDMDAGRVPGLDTGTREYQQYPTEMYAELFAYLSLISTDQATKDDYGQRARTLLMYVMNQAVLGPASGQPFRDPCFATCDSNRSRWYGEGFALTVDWAYPYFTAADKATIRTVFLRWAQEIVQSSYHIPQPIGVVNSPSLVADPATRRWAGNNYFTAHMRNLGLMAMALDPSDDPGNTLRNYLSNATGAWLYMVDYLMRNDTAGGLFPEGFEYSPQTVGYVTQFLLALHTAGQDDPTVWGPQVTFSGNSFWNDVIPAYLHSLSPRQAQSHELQQPVYLPAWYGDGTNYWTPDFIAMFAPLGLYDYGTGNAARLSAIRWIEVNTPPGGAPGLNGRARDENFFTNCILYFMLFDPSASMGSDPHSTLPLTFFAPGAGRILARTDWGQNATWFTYRLAWASIDHQLEDGNQFELYRRGEWLTKERTGYDLDYGSTDYHNSVALQNDQPQRDASDYRTFLWQRGSQWGLLSSADPRIVAHSFGAGYVYALGDATNLYNSTYEGLSDITHASRSIIWLVPDRIVVYDRAASQTANRFKRFWLNTPTLATVTGNQARATTPSGQQLFLTNLLPAGASVSAESVTPQYGEVAIDDPMGEIPGSTPPHSYRVRVDAPGGPTSVALVQSSGGTAFEGAALAGTVVLFPVDLAPPFASMTYLAPAGASHQIVTGLAPSASYTVAAQPAPGGMQVTVSPGPGTMTDSGGVLVFDIAASGGPTSTPTTTAVPGATASPTGVPSATATQPTAGIGGKGFGISSAADGVRLSWSTGTGQTGYQIARLAAGTLSVLPALPLDASATSFLDTTAPAGLNCYVLLPLGTSPQQLSDLLCAVVGFRTPTGAPQSFTLRLNQSTTASLSWGPPAGTSPDGYLLLPIGGQLQSLGPTVTSATAPANGFTCFVVGATVGGSLTGYSDLACGLPGFATLSP